MVRDRRQSRPFPRIVRDPRVLEGEPVVAGTRVPVRCLVIALQLHASEARVLKAYPHITLEDLREALRYYASHRDLIDHYIAQNEDEDGAPASVRPHKQTHAQR